MNVYFLVIASAVLVMIGDFVAKTWAIKNIWFLLPLSLTIFVVANFFFILTVKKASLSLAVVATDVSTIVLSLLVAYFYFGERLTTPQYFGLAFSLVGLILLTFPFEVLQK